MLSRRYILQVPHKRFRGPGLEKHFKKIDKMLWKVPFSSRIQCNLWLPAGRKRYLPSCLQETDNVKGIKEVLAAQQAPSEAAWPLAPGPWPQETQAFVLRAQWVARCMHSFFLENKVGLGYENNGL